MQIIIGILWGLAGFALILLLIRFLNLFGMIILLIVGFACFCGFVGFYIFGYILFEEKFRWYGLILGFVTGAIIGVRRVAKFESKMPSHSRVLFKGKRDEFLSFPPSAVIFLHNGENRKLLLKIAAYGFSMVRSLQWYIFYNAGYVTNDYENLNKFYANNLEERKSLGQKTLTALQNLPNIDRGRVLEIREIYQFLQWIPLSILEKDERHGVNERRGVIDSTLLSENEKKYLLYEEEMADAFYDDKLKLFVFLKPGASRSNPKLVGPYFPFALIDLGEGGPVKALREIAAERYSKLHALALEDDDALGWYLASIRYMSDVKVAFVLDVGICDNKWEDQVINDFRKIQNKTDGTIIVRPSYKLVKLRHPYVYQHYSFARFAEH